MFICLTQKEPNQALAEQVLLVFSRYDTDEDGTLSYTEFCQIFLPQSQENSKLMEDLISRRPKNYGDLNSMT